MSCRADKQVLCSGYGLNMLLRGQAQNGVNFDFEVKFDLEGQGQSPPPPIKNKQTNKTKQNKNKKTQNNRGLNHGLLHIWSKFGDLSLNGWWVVARTSKCLAHTQTDGRTHRQTDAGNGNTRRPKLALGKNGHLWKHILSPFNIWNTFSDIGRYII